MAKSATRYNEDDLPTYDPLSWSLEEIRTAIPAQLFVRSTTHGMLYLLRDVIMVAICWYLATLIDPFFGSTKVNELLTPAGARLGRYAAWATYWWFQGLIFTGIWVIGHECGHGAFSANNHVNDFVGFLTHTFLWTPYFTWRSSHHRHHSNHNLMEHDDVYVPRTRADLGIPDSKSNDKIDWDGIFGDTPLYTLFMLITQQLLAFPAYLIYDVSKPKNYSKWKSHFIMSNIGISAMVWATVHFCSIYGTTNVIKYYLFPWLQVSHWFVMITYLHHTDPVLPHYRGKAWNFQRGAAATVDRPFLGWQGRFFLHNVAHYHVIHHFFPKIPFYHAPEATQHLKAFIGDSYAFDDTPVFKALWNNYNTCQFVDNEGDVLFYRDKKGEAQRRPSSKYCGNIATID